MEPAAAFDRAMHQRLLAGDPIAPSELAEAYLEPLTHWLQQRFRNVHDEHLIFEAAIDALLNHSEHPSRFDPLKSRLFTYLKMSAQGDLRNAMQKERRRTRRQTPTEAVELSTPDGNRPQEEDERIAAAQNFVQEIFEKTTDPRERRLLELILDGERRTAAYADVLGIQDHDAVEQRKIVKRHKDRLKKRLERWGAKRRG